MAGEAVRAVLDHVWKSLEPLGCPRALTGGLALAVWNHPRSTRDIDLLVAVPRDEIDRLVKVLEAAGCRPKHAPALRKLGDLRLAQFLYSPPGECYDVQFDLLLAETPLEKSALGRRIKCSVPGVSVPIDVLKCEDLILLKLASGRLIDHADAASLMRENRDTIDFQYLRSWAERLRLMGEVTKVWNEARPGESLPS
jgi:Nucleotidyl transferase AbiEii toxin, Type IV TA system